MIEDVARPILGFLIMFIPGLLLIDWGIWLLKGNAKGWYFARHSYAGAVYANIPFGIGIICIAFAAIPDSQTVTDILLFTGVFFVIVGIIFNFIRPSFLKPAWLRWLEEKYDHYMMTILKAEAHEMGLELWQSKMQTQADIEAWAEEVWQKHSKMRHEQRLKRRTS